MSAGRKPTHAIACAQRSNQFRNRLGAIEDRHGPAGGILELQIERHAEELEESRKEVLRRNWVRLGVAALRIRFADDLAHLHAAAGEHKVAEVRPVFTSAVLVDV